MKWNFNGEGAWTAHSRVYDEGDHFEYTIAVCDDGSFDVSESDDELLGGTPPHKRSFPSLKLAQDWCEANEVVLGFSLEERSA